MADTKVTLIRGDGIGPEITDSVAAVFDAANAGIEWEEVEAGLGAVKKCGKGISPESLEVIRKNKVALKGPTETPVGGGHQSINVLMRKALDLYVNLRPSLTIPGVETPFNNVNLLIVRENIEDTYGGLEYQQSPDQAQCLRIVTRSGSLRCHEFAFETARKFGRKKISCVHKANIMKITDGIFLETFREVAKKYPDIQANDIIVDNCCMQLVSKPSQFDVLVLPNLFGDIVSDLCAGLVGGLGVASGANLGKENSIFEAVHGSAPDIAGKGLANPTALLLSSVSMLRHLNKAALAEKIEQAILTCLKDPRTRTKDLKGQCSTKEFTSHIINHLGAKS